MKIKWHRNNEITVWDVYSQTHTRLTDKEAFADDALMASLNASERARIEARAHDMTLTIAKGIARKLTTASDDEGIIQAEDMLSLFPRDHMLHRTCSLENIAREIGVYYSLD